MLELFRSLNSNLKPSYASMSFLVETQFLRLTSLQCFNLLVIEYRLQSFAN